MSTLAAERREGARAAVKPVVLWAGLGAALLALELWFEIKWVASSNFTPIHSGPDVPPVWMRAALITGQVVFVAGALLFFYFCLVRTWRRERRISTDGLMCIVFLLASPYDELSNYFHYWFTYNSYMVNMGSLMGGLPGVVQPHTATANEAWPIILIPGAYVTIFVGMAILGSRFMSRLKGRHPGIGPVRLVLACYLLIMLSYLVIDGVICMPLGFWAFPGGHWPINGTSYFKYPMNEMVFAGLVFTFPACVRYFTDDRGYTFPERGVDGVAAGPARKALLRGLALLAVLHIGLLLTYHLPQGLLAQSGTAWPRDFQARSYLTDGICGAAVHRACPGTVPVRVSRRSR